MPRTSSTTFGGAGAAADAAAGAAADADAGAGADAGRTPTQPRVWVDGTALMGRITGVQRYVENLLAAVQRTGELELRAFRFVGDGPPRNLDGDGGSASLSWRTALAHRRAYAAFSNRLVAPPLEVVLRTRPGLFLFPDFVTLPVTPFSRSVVVIYDLSFFTVAQLADAGLGAYLRKRVPQSIARAAHIVTISRFAADEIVERFPSARGRTTVVYPAADARFAPSDDDAHARFRERIGLDRARPYLLFVGTLEPRKNIVGVLDAYAALPAATRARAPLVIAGGKGWRDDEIVRRLQRATSDASTGVKQIGYVDDNDLPLLYGSARALVFPSLYEGFGLPPLEAMACGTPAIASSTTALPEVVGDAGLLVAPTDTSALRAAMERMIDDDALHAQLRSRVLAQARRFSWDASARIFVDVLKNAAAR